MRPMPLGPWDLGSPVGTRWPATGIAVALYPSDITYDIELQRAPDSAGAPNTAAAETVSAAIPSDQPLFVDDLPLDGATRWYRCRHVGFGDTPSAWTGWISAVPTTIPANVTPPAAVLPVIKESFAQTATNGTCTLDILDPQSRVTKVEFDTQAGSGAATGFVEDTTAPYTASVAIASPGSYIAYRVTGYDGFARLAVLEQNSMAFGSASAPRLLVIAELLTPSTTAPVYRVTVSHNGSTGSPNVSLAYTVSTGLAVSPTSPQVIVVAPGAGTSVDFTVTLPALPGTAPQGRIVWIATATDYITGSVPLDISDDYTPPSFEVTTAQSSTAYTFTYSSSGTVYYRVDSGAWAFAPASPFDVSRNTAGGADKTVQIKAVGANGVVDGPRTFTVPAQASGGSGAEAVVWDRGYISVDYVTDEVTVNQTYFGTAPVGHTFELYRLVDTLPIDYSTSASYVGDDAAGSPVSYPDSGHGYNLTSGAGANVHFAWCWRQIDTSSAVVAQSPWITATLKYT